MQTPSRGHRAFEHTADLGIEAWGPDLSALLEEVVAGLCGLIAEVATIEASAQREVEVDGADREELMVSLSNEVLYFLDAEQFFSKDLTLSSVEYDGELWHAKGVLHGEPNDSQKHNTFTEIKSATYHDLKVQDEADGLRVKIVFDV